MRHAMQRVSVFASSALLECPATLALPQPPYFFTYLFFLSYQGENIKKKSRKHLASRKGDQRDGL